MNQEKFLDDLFQVCHKHNIDACFVVFACGEELGSGGYTTDNDSRNVEIVDTLAVAMVEALESIGDTEMIVRKSKTK